MKTSALMTIKPRSDWGESTMEDVLKCVFPRRPEELSLVAGMILNEIARQGEMPVSDWKNFLKRHPGISQASYYSAIRQLLGVGLIGKEKGKYYLSDRFSETLRRMAAIWDSRMGKLLTRSQMFDEVLVEATGPERLNTRPSPTARARRSSQAR
ncbi:MAG TPA: hypothetical protein ENO31_01280 [Thermoprotei archaeon]|nr:hypothetical protein [Thermoprotei archaeon]